MTSLPVRRAKPFTGRHMAAILVAGFGVVVAVNFTMAGLASSTFGGVVVENSYVASQKFNGWLEKAEKAKALGWELAATRRADGRVAAQLTNVPPGASVTAQARHPLGRMPDMALTLYKDASGAWVSTQILPAARWTVRFEVQFNGETWRTEQRVGAGA